MAVKNYYVMLGVSTDETQAGIRARFRDLARSHHPDVAGPGATHVFQELSEAYEVLGDPKRRASHDRQLGMRSEPLPRPARTEAEPLVSRDRRRSRPTPRVEPLIPEPVSILSEPESIRPSFAALVNRFKRNFTGLSVPKHERLEGLNLQLLLDPEEAARGGLLPVGVPMFRPCAACGGMGRDWMFPCLHCRGEGVIQEERVVGVHIPPMTRPNAVIEVPLHGLGIHNFILRLHVGVDSRR